MSNFYVAQTMAWVQNQYQNLVQDAVSTPDALSIAGSESVHSGELIEWDETVFCQAKMQEFENKMLHHRVHELEKQVENLNGGNMAVTRSTAHNSAVEEAASLDYLTDGFLLDARDPIRRTFVRLIHERRKAEAELRFMRHDRDMAINDLRDAWKRTSEPTPGQASSHTTKTPRHPSTHKAEENTSAAAVDDQAGIITPPRSEALIAVEELPQREPAKQSSGSEFQEEHQQEEVVSVEHDESDSTSNSGECQTLEDERQDPSPVFGNDPESFFEDITLEANASGVPAETLFRDRLEDIAKPEQEQLLRDAIACKIRQIMPRNQSWWTERVTEKIMEMDTKQMVDLIITFEDNNLRLNLQDALNQ